MNHGQCSSTDLQKEKKVVDFVMTEPMVFEFPIVKKARLPRSEQAVEGYISTNQAQQESKPERTNNPIPTCDRCRTAAPNQISQTLICRTAATNQTQIPIPITRSHTMKSLKVLLESFVLLDMKQVGVCKIISTAI